MKNRSSQIKVSSGFTLIEMLVVVLIILLLAGMLLKIAGLVGEKAARAKAIADIANLEFALAEYYSEYDIYPPTSQNGYVYESYAGQPEGMQDLLDENNDPKDDGFITDSDERVVREDPEYAESTGGAIGYQYGLVSYLWTRDINEDGDDNPVTGNQPHWYDKDTERDVLAKKRWEHFLKDINLNTYGVRVKRSIKGTPFVYTNSVKKAVDPWGRGYNYQCKPPFLKYKLWSTGPKSGDAGDDVNNDAFNE